MWCSLCLLFVIASKGSCLQLTTVDQLIRNTFNGFVCINVHYSWCSSELCLNDSGVIVERLHDIGFTIITTTSLANGNPQCGYVLISDTNEILYTLQEVVFDQVVRVLFLQLSDDDVLFVLEEIANSLRDKDFVLAAFPDSGTPSIYSKSRYESKAQSRNGNVDFLQPFFHPKNEPPRNISLQKQTIKLTTFHCPIYNSVIDDELVDGVETRIYKELERKLNFTTDLTVPSDGKRWGNSYPNGTISGGIMKILHERKADIGFCSIWVESSKLTSMKFSTYWDVVCLQFLVPKPKVLPIRWYNVFTPLPNSIWILVLVAAAVAWAACILFTFLEAKLIDKLLDDMYLISELLTLTGILLHAKNPEPNHGKRVNRHMYMWWSVFTLVVTSQYSTSLISHLTYPNFEPMRENVEDLVKGGYYWGTPYDILMSCVFNLDNPWHRKFVNSFVYERSLKDRLDNLSKGNYSILVHKVGDRHFMEVDNIPVDKLRALRTSRACVMHFYLGFGFSKTFPLAVQIDSIIMRLVESGITKYWLNRVFEPKYPLTTFARVYEFKAPPEEIQLAALGFSNLKGAFLIWMVGILLAWMIFIGEIAIEFRMKEGRKQRQEESLVRKCFE